MSNEVQVSLSGTYSKNGETIAFPSLSAFNISVSGNGAIASTMVTSTAETAIPLAGVVPRRMIVKNLDTVNNIKIKHASSGTVISNLDPGDCDKISIDSTVTAPTATATAGTPILAYVVLPA